MITITRGHDTECRPSRVLDVTPTVFIVDGDATSRASLQFLIQASGWCAETFASSGEFLARRRARVPSCLIIPIAMPDFDGLDVQRRVAADRPETPVVFIGAADIRVVVQAMKAGAVEFLAAPWCDEALVDAIECALERSRYVLERQTRLAELHESYRSLTPREREVMVLVVSGLLNKQVGGELGISEITVKAHRGQVMRKMKAASLPALVHMVADLGLPTPPMGLTYYHDTNVSIPSANGAAIVSLVSCAYPNEPVPTHRRLS
jgi:FixJ family two-component response regulator